MPLSRYNSITPIVLNDDSYFSILKERGINSINCVAINKLKYPTFEQQLQLNIQTHIWKTGDRFYKLSQKFYGSPAYWWVIPFFNLKPLEADFSSGDVVSIPLPLEKIINILKVE